MFTVKWISNSNVTHSTKLLNEEEASRITRILHNEGYRYWVIRS